MIHPNRQNALLLGRSSLSIPAKIDVRDFVDVEKAKAFPVSEQQVVDWSTLIKVWPMFLNDQLGDCTCAAAGHGEQIFSAAVAKPFTVTDENIQTMYEASGYKPGQSKTDQGWTLAAAAGYLRTKGLQGKPNIVAYAQVSITDDDAQQVASQLFGGLYEGASMPNSAQTQYQAGRIWTPTNGGRDAGSWSGHCMWRPQSVLRKSGLHVTWGGVQGANEAWEKAYIDELMVFVPVDWETKVPAQLLEAGIVDFSKLSSLVAKFTT